MTQIMAHNFMSLTRCLNLVGSRFQILATTVWKRTFYQEILLVPLQVDQGVNRQTVRTVHHIQQLLLELFLGSE